MLKPTSTLRRFCSVRRNRPAAINSTSEIATCRTSSALLKTLREPATDRLLSFSDALTFMPVARSAGAMPKTRPVVPVMPNTNASTRQSNGSCWPALPGNSCWPHRPTSTPSAPPIAASRRLSVSSWRTSRPRVAPSDNLIEISRCRVAARDSSRLATLAHTINRIRTTTTLRIVTALESEVLTS